jgi:hypothetical protein
VGLGEGVARPFGLSLASSGIGGWAVVGGGFVEFLRPGFGLQRKVLVVALINPIQVCCLL